MNTVMINIAAKDVPDSVRLTGKAHMVTVIKDKDVILNVDGGVIFSRIQEAFWHTLPYCKSFKVTSEDLGVAFLVETAR